jgi:hypothetical protein
MTVDPVDRSLGGMIEVIGPAESHRHPQARCWTIIGSPRSPDQLRYCDRVGMTVGPNSGKGV